MVETGMQLKAGRGKRVVCCCHTQQVVRCVVEVSGLCGGRARYWFTVVDGGRRYDSL